MSLHEKGDQTRALNHNSNLQTVFVWTFQIRKRLRISLPKFVEEVFYQKSIQGCPAMPETSGLTGQPFSLYQSRFFLLN